jgi:hypothetical protein
MALLKADDTGALKVPSSMLPNSKANAEYEVSARGNHLVIKPVAPKSDFWTKLTPQERAEKFSAWVKESTVSVGLSDYAVSRESIYEDR